MKNQNRGNGGGEVAEPADDSKVVLLHQYELRETVVKRIESTPVEEWPVGLVEISIRPDGSVEQRIEGLRMGYVDAMLESMQSLVDTLRDQSLRQKARPDRPSRFGGVVLEFKRKKIITLAVLAINLTGLAFADSTFRPARAEDLSASVVISDSHPRIPRKAAAHAATVAFRTKG